MALQSLVKRENETRTAVKENDSGDKEILLMAFSSKSNEYITNQPTYFMKNLYHLSNCSLKAV